MKIFYLLLFVIHLSNFIVKSQSVYNAYWGNLHSHTSYSDAEGTPAEAFNYACYTAQIDFLAVTDHLE